MLHPSGFDIRFNSHVKWLDNMPVIGYNNVVSKKLYSTKEAAKKLGLSPDHVKRLARDGDIKAQKLGHDWVILSLDYKRKRKQKGERKNEETKFFKTNSNGS